MLYDDPTPDRPHDDITIEPEVEFSEYCAHADPASSKPQRGDDAATAGKVESKPKLSQGPPKLHYALQAHLHFYQKVKGKNRAIAIPQRHTWPTIVDLLFSKHQKPSKKENAPGMINGELTGVFSAEINGKTYSRLVYRKKQHLQGIYFALLDVDSCAVPFATIADRLDALGINHAIYTSWSHDPAGQHKYRIVIPLAEKASPADLVVITWGAAAMLGLSPADCDSASAVPSQQFYLPSSATGKGELYTEVDKKYALPSELMAWHKTAEAMEGSSGGVEETGSLLSALSEHDLLISGNEEEDKHLIIKCPWRHKHTPGSGKTAHVWFPGSTEPHCENGGFKCFHDHCKGRRYPQLLKKLKLKKQKLSVVAQLHKQIRHGLRNYLFVIGTGKVLDTISGAPWGLDNFRKQRIYGAQRKAFAMMLDKAPTLANTFPNGLIPDYTERNNLLYTVDDVLNSVGVSGRWSPDAGLGGHKATLYSQWKDPRKATCRNDELVDEHIIKWGHEVFDPDHFNYLCDGLAYVMQNPGLPPQMIYILEGMQALGKTAVVKVLLVKTFFSTAVTSVSRGDMFGDKDFNEFLTRSIVLLDDFAATTADEAERLRTYRAGGQMLINPKYGKQRDAHTCPLFIATRNPQADNTRYVVPGDRSDCQLSMHYPRQYFDIKDAEGVTAANLWLSDYIRQYVENWKRNDVVLAFRYFLANRDISGFVPGRAIETEGSQEVQQGRMSKFDIIMETLWGHGGLLADVGMVTTHAVIEYAEQHLQTTGDFDEQLTYTNKRAVKKYMLDVCGWVQAASKGGKKDGRLRLGGFNYTVLIRPSLATQLKAEDRLSWSGGSQAQFKIENRYVLKRYLTPSEDIAKKVLATAGDES